MNDDPKPKRQTPFSPGGSHYRPPSGPGWGGDATGREARPYDGVYESPGAAKSAGKSVAAEIRERIAAHKLTLADKLVHLAQHAEAEAVQLAATNSALDRLMGKPQQSVDMTTNGETLGYVIAAPPEVPEADEWATQHKPR